MRQLFIFDMNFPECPFFKRKYQGETMRFQDSDGVTFVYETSREQIRNHVIKTDDPKPQCAAEYLRNQFSGASHSSAVSGLLPEWVSNFLERQSRHLGEDKQKGCLKCGYTVLFKISSK